MASPRVEKILRQVSDTAAKLMDLDNFYAALLDETTGQLAFPFAVSNGNELETGEGKWAPRPYKGPAILPDYVMEIGHSVLAEPDLKSWMATNKVAYWEDQVPLSWLGAPMAVGTKVLGVLVAENYGKARAFDSGARTVLSSIANQAATAIANARLYERLDSLNEVGQKLTSGIRLHQDEILELIYEQASQLMDTRNMYIALYDEETDMVSFGLAMQDGNRVDVERDTGWAPRKAGKGKTEEIIRTQKPILHRTKREAEQWYAAEHEEYIGQIASSWLGVPMIVGEKVFGVIAIYNWDQENVYSQDDLEVLQTMADQAAIAIENASLYKQLERKYIELETEYIAREQLAALGTATAALQHRISNTLNLVNPGIMRLRRRIDPNDKDAAETLDIMERNVRYTSQIISRLQEPLKEEDATVTDVNSRLKEIVQDVREREPGMCQKVSFDLDGLSPDIPRIEIGTGQLTEVLRNLVENACKAMQPQGGTLTLSSRLVGSTIEVEFQDTGPGIPPNILDRLFARPVPPKDFEAGTGLGLWLSKLILQKYGGDIKVKETREGEGTTMLIHLPAIQLSTTQQAESEDKP